MDLRFFASSITALTDTSAASSTGYPKAPVEIAGNAIDLIPFSSATFRLFLKQSASFSAGFFSFEYTGVERV